MMYQHRSTTGESRVLTHWDAEQTDKNLYACDSHESVENTSTHHPIIGAEREAEAEKVFED